MGIKLNELSFKGMSSGDFPFKVAVVENDGINVINTNAELKQYKMRTGASKRYNRHRAPIRKRYVFEILTRKQAELDLVKGWLNGEGWLEPSDEPNRRYWVYQIEAYSARLSNVDTYELEVTFVCHPYAMSKVDKLAQVISDRLIFDNNGTAETYPTFEFTSSRDLRMFALSHPDGQALQIGYENGPVVIPSGARVSIDTSNNKIFVNGVRKYFTPSSRIFAVEPGRTEIGVTVNTGATIPVVKGKFKEAFL